MFYIGPTQKLKKEMGIELEEAPKELEKSLNTWHMNMFKVGRYKCVVVMNDLTLYNLESS